MKNKLQVILYIFLLSILGSQTSLFAQNSIEIEKRLISVTELLKEVKSKSDYTIYFNENETDTVLVSISGKDTPENLLTGALASTNFKVSMYKNKLFVLKDITIVNQLPEWINRTIDEEYLSSSSRTNDSIDYTPSFLLTGSNSKDATSELIVYEVGNPNLKQQNTETLSGYVVDAKTGGGIAGVVVYIKELEKHAVTNSTGRYSLAIPSGKYNLQVSGAGVSETFRQVQFYSKGTLNIQTIDKVHALQEVTVQGERRDNIRQTTLGVEHLKMKEVKNIPTAFGEADIISIIKSLPGVKSVGEMSTGFNVRGGATDQNLINVSSI